MDKVTRSMVEYNFGPIEQILHTATILHKGWEMDNEGWIIRFKGGIVQAITTNHGSPCPWTQEEAKASIAEAEASIESLKKALELWP
jgi:hypothetical protein